MTTINDIFVSYAQEGPDQSITPAGTPVGSPPTDGIDNIRVTSNGGSEGIVGYTIDSAGGADTVTLNGSPIRNIVDLGAGADTFAINTIDLGGSITDSTVDGGAGNDILQVLVNGAGVVNTSLNGANGSDLFELRGSFSRVSLNGGQGFDVVRFLNPGNDGRSNFARSNVALGSEADLFTDGGFPLVANETTVRAGAGKDTVILLDSTTGFDAEGTLINGGGGADKIYGTADGENTVEAGAGFDFVQTFADDDSVIGGGGSDTLLLGASDDFADAGDGNDVVYGEDDNDTIDGGLGRDIILGGYDEDLIYGGDGDFQDLLAGGDGEDTIDGGSGGDLIFGDDLVPGCWSFPSSIEWSNEAVRNLGNWTQGIGAFVVGTQIPVPTDNDEIGLTNIVGRESATTINGPDQTDRQGPTLGEIVSFSVDGDEFLDAAGDPLFGAIEAKSNTQPQTAPFGGQTLQVEGNVTAWDDGGLLLDVYHEGLLAINLAAPGSFDPKEGNFYVGQDGSYTFYGEDYGYDDVLNGDSGNDTIFGGGGDDTITGGLGNDIIIGNEGVDVMTGDDGADIFVQGTYGDYVEDSFYFGYECPASSAANTATLTTFWTFNWTTPGNGPDIITDFTAVSNTGAVVDQIAFGTFQEYDSLTDTANDLFVNPGVPPANQFSVANAFGVDGYPGLRVINATGSADYAYHDSDFDEVVVFRGTWTASNRQFSTSENGADVLVFRSEQNAVPNPASLNPSALRAAEMGDQAVVLLGAGNQQFIGDNFFGTFA